MQELKSDNKLDIVETVSVIGSIGGAIASLVFNQVALASIPLSMSVALNLLNRRRRQAVRIIKLRSLRLPRTSKPRASWDASLSTNSVTATNY